MKTSILLCFVAIFTFGGIPTIHPLPLTLGGTKATEGQFPFFVSIQTLEEGHICGGSIINKRWILTAAHCISLDKIQREPNQLQILAGTIHLDKGGVRYNVEKIILHPDFKYVSSRNEIQSLRNDIALLKVDQDIKFNNLTSSFPLASSGIAEEFIGISGGWGESTAPMKVTNDLQFLYMYVAPSATCNENIKDFDINIEICAIPTIPGAGMCRGDSGGPLVYNEDIVGVLSCGPKCSGPDHTPAVFTKVASFKDWINEKIGQ